LEQRPAFLGFVQRRVGDAGLAEDILQEALIRAMDRVDDIQEEARVGWFYKVLENAITDHHRRTSTATRAYDRLGDELADAVQTVDDAPARTCKCVTRLKAELKPEYAEALERIEVDEVAVKDFADEAGISRSNAAVRVFRAREALRQKVQTTCGHCAAAGCVDCSCVS
ncbi:MAG: sigma-70 family RNA polymerase sigma factor, partial [Myxococcaceae bacterium]